jgi:hypothetical protein
MPSSFGCRQQSIKSMSSDILQCAEKLESRLVGHVLSNAQWVKSGHGSAASVKVNIVEWTSGCT